MKPSQIEIKCGVISALELLNEGDPELYFTAQQVNDCWEESKDWDSDNLKRGRLGKISTSKVEEVLIEVAGKQLEGYMPGCEIENTPKGFRFFQKDMGTK